MSQPTAILFVCLGNICRSPMAESILYQKIVDRKLDHLFTVDSAGTGNYHIGDWPDPRTLQVLEENGIVYKSRARQVTSDDFGEFDHVIALDHANARDLLSVSKGQSEKISLCQDWNPQATRREVPDPYYGDLSDFREVYQMLDAATDGILTSLQKT